MQDAKAGAPLDCFSMLTRVTHRNSSITNKSCHSKTGNSVRRRHASPFTVRDIGVHMGAEFDDHAQLLRAEQTLGKAVYQRWLQARQKCLHVLDLEGE